MPQPEQATPLVHDVAFRTDIGRSHHVNQDAGGAWTWTRQDGVPASLAIVADGVSAGQRSEDASRLVVQMIYDTLAPMLRDGCDVTSALDALLQATREA